jgi:hypothetical protein
MADAIENLTALIHLPQFPLRVGFVAAVNHQVIDDQTNTRPDAKSVFRK